MPDDNDIDMAIAIEQLYLEKAVRDRLLGIEVKVERMERKIDDIHIMLSSLQRRGTAP